MMIYSRFFAPEKRSAKARYQVYHCEIDNCPLLEKDQCIVGSAFLSSCIYGKVQTVVGPTLRSNKYRAFKSQCPESPRKTLSRPPHCIEFIGDYVWLPYSYMHLCDQVPLQKGQGEVTLDLEYDGFMSMIGSERQEFLLREDFTLNTIRILVQFRAFAMFGGEIAAYQKSVVPLFLFHLKHLHPDIFPEEFTDRVLKVTHSNLPPNIPVDFSVANILTDSEEPLKLKISNKGRWSGYEGLFYVKELKNNILFLVNDGIKMKIDITMNGVALDNTSCNDQLALALAESNPRLVVPY